MALSCFGATAQAVFQPAPAGTLVVPVIDTGKTTCEDKNVEHCIDGSEGNAALIAAQPDALVAPETFQPSCKLTFKPLVKGGGDHAAFGWYNVKPDPANVGKFLKPAQNELYGMFNLPRDNTSGAVLAGLPEGQVASLDLAAEEAAGRYKGGAIGFFLAAAGDLTGINPTTRNFIGTFALDRIYYTQHELNAGSTKDSTYYQVLTWQSEAFPNAFYFGWEDQTASGTSDNDFDDLLFLVTGIQCSGGGEACDTGKDGVCAAGTNQCKKGELTCVQNIPASAEECNALDDDCNALVDDGDLCEKGFVCDRGRCVPKCSTGEFRCTASDLVCNSRGVCVEPACAEKECPAGQVCHAGACVDSCAGVKCPYGEVCHNGGCIDPCTGVECDEGFSCVLGVCRSCECSACLGGQICHEKQCVDVGCETQTCIAGAHCVAGACVDDCQGTVCPTGQLCAAGQCQADPNAVSSSGGSGGSGGESLVLINPGNGKGGSQASGGTGATSGGDGVDNGAGPGRPVKLGDGTPESAAGCGCTVPRRASAHELGLLLVAAALGLRRRRRS